MRKRRSLKKRPLDRVTTVARRLIKTRLLFAFVVLFVLGFGVGLLTQAASKGLPFDDLFGNLSVVAYRHTGADANANFMVELSSGGKAFAIYDVDAKQFRPPPQGHDYSQAITGTRYEPLRVRGHVDEGIWLELPDSDRQLHPWQFDQVYRTTLSYVRPLSVMGGILGTLSGYSLGYRLGTWSSSLSRPAVQGRVLLTPGIGRMVTREAWRRVLLEPLVTAQESDAVRFAKTHGAQLLYTNFFKVALNDSDGFIPREAARLVQVGRPNRARAMLDYVGAVRRASRDVHLESADFVAIERWASLLHREGHWSVSTIPPAGEQRVRYLGALAWYGLAPIPPETRRVWVGPRMLVQSGDAAGFVADEIPATGIGCPIVWRPWLEQGGARTSAEAVARGWLADRPEFDALVGVGKLVRSRLLGLV